MSSHSSIDSSDSLTENPDKNLPRELYDDDFQLLSKSRSNVSQLSAGSKSFDEPILISHLKKSYSGRSNNGIIDDEATSVTSNALDRETTRHSIVSVLSKRADDEVLRLESQQGPQDLESAKSKTPSLLPEEISEANPLPTKVDGTEFASLDPELVTWDTEKDSNYPRNWKTTKKAKVLLIASIYTFAGQITSSACAVTMKQIDKSFDITNSYFSASIVSIFLLTQGLSALFISPLSEMYGRRIIFHISIIVLLLSNLGCALSKNSYTIFICRFINGIGAAGGLTVGVSGGVASPVLGPIYASFVVQYIGWRWVFWILVIMDGASLLIGVFTLNETYSPVLLHWKCTKLKKTTGNPHLKTIYDITDLDDTLYEKLKTNIIRPFEMLFGHPMIYGLGIFNAFLFGFFYLILTSFPTAWGSVYHFDTSTQGLMYLSLGAAFAFWCPIWVIWGNRDYAKRIEANNGVPKPEFRLSLLWVCGVVCPAGLLLFGWTIQYHVHWIVPCIGIFFYTGFYNGSYTFTINYVVDMNPRYSASGSAALSVFRSIFGFVFPIFAPKMYKDIGYGWGNTIFCIVGFLLGIPFPFYVFKYGESLRKKANLKFDKRNAVRDAKKLQKIKEKLEKKNNEEEKEENSSGNVEEIK